MNANQEDYDRKSAGDRFGGHGTSFYQELQKINSLFNCNNFKRRNSVSHSQSHSRVRMTAEQANESVLSLRKQEKQRSPSNTSESLFAQAADGVNLSIHKNNLI